MYLCHFNHKGEINMLTDNAFLPSFLFAPRYRMWRHLLWILAGVIITFNQVFIAYQDCQNMLGNRIYLICFSSFLQYLIAMYFNYFYLTPRFLLKGKYIAYSILLCVVVFSLPTLAIWHEYLIRSAFDLPHRITSYTNPLILVDNLASCMIIAICFCGISVVMLFRHWMTGNAQVSKLEEEHLHLQLVKLKGQITPAFLSRTLRHSSEVVETNPAKTTHMLMELSQLLRYQLYDCNREKILLKSEIGFLARFLALEQSNNLRFGYQIDSQSSVGHLFVSPMLFISIVQHAIQDSSLLDLKFNFENGCLFFTCKFDSERVLSGEVLSLTEKRLELQYPGKHTLTLNPGRTELNINMPA